MQVIPLGCMGWMPRHDNHTAAYLVRGLKTELILDAGTGLCRLADMAANVPESEPVVMLLSHYHLDHTAGLIYLSALYPRRRIVIAAPGKAVYGESAAAILDRLVGPPYFAHRLSRGLSQLEIIDLVPGENHICGLTIHCRLQTHSHPSLGIRIEDRLAYITDTGCSTATAEFVSGCPLLMHECWGRGDEVAASGHSHLEGVLGIARQAAVKQLLLVHINPLMTQSEISDLETAARREFPATAIARDLVPWPHALANAQNNE